MHGPFSRLLYKFREGVFYYPWFGILFYFTLASAQPSSYSLSVMRRFLSTIAVAVFLVATCLLVPVSPPAFGDDGEHSDSPAPKRKGPILSFSKFEGALRGICSGLEQEGRSARIFEVATVRRKEEKACVSCRALWVSLSSTCKPPKVEKSSQKKISKKKTSHEGDEEQETAEEQPIPTPVPTPIPKRRYPNPAVLDAVSRLAVAMYEYDEGGESAKAAVFSIAEGILAIQNLSVAEREYYEILFEYFKAPWQGIPGTPTPKVEEDMSSFFE